MSSVRLVTDEEPAAVQTAVASSTRVWGYIATGAVLLAMIETWLVWFSAFIQRNLQEEDMRTACQRTMPETAQRCFDTVVIQRGGVRR